jgi:hypothetical protein
MGVDMQNRKSKAQISPLLLKKQVLKKTYTWKPR